MKTRFQYCIVLPFLALLLSSCATTPVHQGLGDSAAVPASHNFRANMKNALDASIDAIKGVGAGDIAEIDHTGGTITTQYRDIDTNTIDQQTSGYGTRFFKYRYRVQLQPAGPAETEVLVDVDVQTVYGGFYPVVEKQPLLENRFRQALFSRICENIYPDHSVRCDVFPLQEPEIVVVPEPEPVKHESGDKRVATLQKKLQAAGYHPGKADGVWGKKTRDALRAFQADHNLPQTSPWEEQTYKAFDKVLTAKPLPADARVATGGQNGTVGRLPAKGKVLRKTFLMRTANIMADSLFEIPEGTVILLEHKNGDFFQVKYRGHEGFVYSALVEKIVLGTGNDNS